MQKKDLHIHTVFSDGVNTPEQCVIAAVNMGLEEIGFSDHSYIDFKDFEPYWMSAGTEREYKRTINELKVKYKDKISVLCGIEQDYYSAYAANGYDYIIGSVHFLKTDDGFFTVDESVEDIKGNLKYFNNDIYEFIKLYYDTLADVVNKTNCDIIGHFDLVSKFNENSALFDENDKRYVSAYRCAADALIKTGKIFEINTGAISRGYRTQPYPSKQIYDYLKSNGARFILSSDAHKADNIAYKFSEFEKLLNAE